MLPTLAPGVLAEVAEDVFRLCLPLPGRPNHVNVWLLADGPGWLLVDTGIDSAELRALWQPMLDAGPGGRPITRVLATHFHADHAGLAGWLCAQAAAPLLMPRSEWLRARLLGAEGDAEFAEDLLAFHRRAGSPPDHLEFLHSRRPGYRSRMSPLPRSFQAIGAGTVLRVGGRDWHVLVGAGHTPEMACLWAPALDVLISADHILPRISPHIGIVPWEPQGDPLSVFLAALARFRELPAQALVLPSHGEPFHGLHRRIDALVQHHAERLDALHRAVAEAGARGLSAYGAVPAMFGRSFEHERLHSAAAEAMAHLACLRESGVLHQHTGDDGVLRFAPAPDREKKESGP